MTVAGDGTFEMLVDAALDVDDDGLRQRRGSGESVIDDRDITMLRHQNRIALAKGPTVRLPTPESVNPAVAFYDVPLICVVHAAPGCRFRWARLVVDLSPTHDARIQDMAPREVRSDRPVEIKTTVGVGLRFESVFNVLSAEVKPEYSSSRTVYYAQILTSGPGFARGYWDFHAGGDAYLHSNRELRLLVSAPMGVPLLARFRLRAEVALGGLARIVPLLNRSGEIDELYSLT